MPKLPQIGEGSRTNRIGMVLPSVEYPVILVNYVNIFP